MINQSLDVSKLGFRWTGVYDASKTYVNGDVAFKEGYAKAYINSVWKDFGIDQRDMIQGSVLLKDGNASGLPGQQFMVRSDGTVGFETPALRSGTLAASLGGQTEVFSHNRTTRNCWHALMSDYSVRAVGSNEDGQMGVGPDGIFVRPVTVPFPTDVKIVRVINGYSVTFFITDTGQLWACGKDQYYGGYGLSEHGVDNAETPVNISAITALAGEKVTDVITNCSDPTGTLFPANMALTASGKVFAWGNNPNGILGLGHDTNVPNPELLYWTEFVPIEKAYILNNSFLDGAGSFLIDYTGKLYVAGDDDVSLFNAANISTHKLLNPWGSSKRVVSVRVNSAKWFFSLHSLNYWRVDGNQNVALIVEDALSNREVYARGGHGMSWGRSITNAPYWKKGETQYIEHNGSQQTVTTDVRDVAFFNLEKLQAVLIDSNGHLFHQGESTFWKAHSSDMSTTHNFWYQFDKTIAKGIVKFYCSFAHNVLTMVALRDDGKIIVAGYNGAASAKLNADTNDGFVEIPPLPFDNKVIDLFVSGDNVSNRTADNSNTPTSENNRQIILLTETGEVYAGGHNTYGTLGKGTLTPSQTFQKVHF